MSDTRDEEQEAAEAGTKMERETRYKIEDRGVLQVARHPRPKI
jgi:hypothetical protein